MNKPDLQIGAVQSGVPIPPKHGESRTSKLGQFRTAVLAMEVGDCREVTFPPLEAPRKYENLVQRAAKVEGRKIATRRQSKGVLKFWRTA